MTTSVKKNPTIGYEEMRKKFLTAKILFLVSLGQLKGHLSESSTVRKQHYLKAVLKAVLVPLPIKRNRPCVVGPTVTSAKYFSFQVISS